MGNGDCTSVSQPLRIKLRPSCVRDFPEGCGPLDSKIDPKTSSFGNSNDTSLKLQTQDLEEKEFISTAKVVECDSSDVSKFSPPKGVLCDGSKFSSSVRNHPSLSGPDADTHDVCTLQLQAIENSNNDDTDAKEVSNNVQDGLKIACVLYAESDSRK
ncbi:unnamed protein product [Sphenostylis stenocarpa]|uniref:Uncharacterized protein n=1 Tax=Sphenostylis stenocarpa TaxID=92480 RepID=A0AA86S668_9FABA|nr:unnamed protein product [Sphenostylis stenocarpa]